MIDVLCKGYHVYIIPDEMSVPPDIMVCTCGKRCLIRSAEHWDGAVTEHSGAEKIYSTQALIRDLTNALESGYQTLGDTDIGDLLLDCEVDDEVSQNAPS